LLGRGR